MLRIMTITAWQVGVYSCVVATLYFRPVVDKWHANNLIDVAASDPFTKLHYCDIVSILVYTINEKEGRKR